MKTCQECRMGFEETRSHPRSKCTNCLEKHKRNRNRLIVKTIRETNPCVVCGEKDPVVLEFHHVCPKDKIPTRNGKSGISGLLAGGRSVSLLKEEIEKCIMVCANDHRRIESGIIDATKYARIVVSNQKGTSMKVYALVAVEVDKVEFHHFNQVRSKIENKDVSIVASFTGFEQDEEGRYLTSNEQDVFTEAFTWVATYEEHGTGDTDFILIEPEMIQFIFEGILSLPDRQAKFLEMQDTDYGYMAEFSRPWEPEPHEAWEIPVERDPQIITVEFTRKGA